MARKRNLFLYNIQPFLKRCKRLILFALLGLMLSLYPWLPSTAREGDPQLLNQQGSDLLAMGKAEAALTTWKKAEELYRNAGHQMGAIGSQINQAQALEALGHYRKSCDRILVAIGSDIIKCDKLTKDDLEQEQILARFQLADESLNFMGLQSLGNMLRKIGKLEESQVVLRESKDKVRSPENLSQAWLNLGNTVQALGKRLEDIDNREQADRAYRYYQNALYCYQKAVLFAKSPEAKLLAQLNLLSFELKEKKPSALSNQEARDLLSEVKSRLDEQPPSQMTVYARINLACSLLGCDRVYREGERKAELQWSISEIEQLLSTALSEAEILENPRFQSLAMGTLGTLYEDTGKLSKAESMTEKAIAEAIDAPDIEYRWEWQMGRLRKQEGDVQGAIGHYEAAFNILQGLRGDLAAFDRDTQFDFKEKVEPVYRDLVKLLLQGETPSQENLKQAREVIEGLQLAELDDYFQEACTNVKQENLDNIIEEAETPTAAIYMIVIEKRLEVIIKLPREKELRYYTKEIPPEIDLNEQIKDIRQGIEGKTYGTDASINDFLLRDMYDQLIGFYEGDLANNGIKTLVFVMEDPLRNFPMAALYDGKQYLVDKYAIALAPGLQLVDTKSLQQRRLKVLAAGLSEARDVFDPLPEVEKELEQIKPDLKLLNEKFTTSELENMISSRTFSILHIATHGKFSSQAEKTFILAWDKRLNVNKLEELLRSRDKNILNPIELLVLSACETAKGDDRAALGIAGVAVRAGARSTLATLWQVADDSTAELMSQFYRNQSENMTTAKALQKAQQFLLHNTDFTHPYYWATLVLLGNWQ